MLSKEQLVYLEGLDGAGSQKGWTQPDSLLISKGIISDTYGKPFITKKFFIKWFKVR